MSKGHASRLYEAIMFNYVRNSLGRLQENGAELYRVCSLTETMKCVALISGGKDSWYNAMQCVANGHEVVALANLRPSPSLPGLPFTNVLSDSRRT